MASDQPDWLNTLVCTKFFDPCNYHPELRKDQFCIDCKLCLCKHCVRISRGCGGCFHNRLLRIRKYEYRDFIDLDVLQQHIDCSSIQVHTKYRKKIVQMTRLDTDLRLFGDTSCENCGWKFGISNDQKGYRFCSIRCQVEVSNHIGRNQRQDSEVPNLEAAEENSSGNAGGSSQSLTAQVNDPPDLIPDLHQPYLIPDLNQPDINQDIDEPERKRSRKSSNPVKFTNSDPQQQ